MNIRRRSENPYDRQILTILKEKFEENVFLRP